MYKIEKAIEIIESLAVRYGDPRSYIAWNDEPLRLLVGTMLAAQERDDKVNRVLDRCWDKYNTAVKISNIPIVEMHKDFQEIGMYDTKCQRIKRVAQLLAADYKGKVPDNYEYLISLPGVGRKTASIVMLYLYGKAPYVAVDTHVKRLSIRIGLVNKKTPNAISNYYQSFPNHIKKKINHTLVSHGKTICRAVNPRCESCSISDLCERNGVKK